MLDIHCHYITKYGIPIKNVWLLILYASEVYKTSKESFSNVEDNLDDLYTVILELLCDQFDKNITKGLSSNYVSRNKNLTRVRGSINFLVTETKMLTQRGKVNCSYDELSLDIPRYQYVLMTLKNALFLKDIDRLRTRIIQYINTLEGLGVTCPRIQNYNLNSDRFGYFDYSEQALLQTCQLLNELKIPAMYKGNHLLPNLEEMSEEWLRKLFEKAIYGFYVKNLHAQVWDVSHNKKLQWQFDVDSNLTSMMPLMEADIILKNNKENYSMLIDTKFNEILIRNRFGSSKFRNGYIYQIYAYLRSQEKDGRPIYKRGILLHPGVGYEISEHVKIQGYSIEFKTINLAGDAKEIKAKLFELL
ncbi:hypothetical protein RFH42_12345 [Acinetobacter rudis]|uniref:5-methylcytosine restriction system specificity protein McrC n=1 Tax=Acinetobacter rudis TaxID=632955 RepID=UPI0028101103|nr:hypothetical protein [Acinetobacter rudis]MDQ8953747.1 hypothetical protein [Acinetobacter rudis]